MGTTTRGRVKAAPGEVQRVLDRAVLEGREGAVQVAVYLEGDLIVDAWAAPAARPVDGDTLFPLFSTGKGIAATAVHRLVERGVLSWDDPIARHWPEFAAHGKGEITLRHALNHTAGLPMMPEAGDMIRPADWDAMCSFLASAAPLHPPGAQRHYHAVTYSWLVGETARRADGRDFGRIVEEEVCRPLGISTLFFGVPAAMLPFCAGAEKALPPAAPLPATAAPPAPDLVSQPAIPSWICPLEDWINREDIRRACIPASNGFGNARAVARHYAALTSKGAGGVRLLSDATITEATRWDAVAAVAAPGTGRWGLGYALLGPASEPGSEFGHGGYGGSIGFADLQRSMAVGIVKSRTGGDLPAQVMAAIFRCLPVR
jgi:CubicO group peptidase (beta-lactamase class C family)